MIICPNHTWRSFKAFLSGTGLNSQEVNLGQVRVKGLQKVSKGQQKVNKGQ